MAKHVIHVSDVEAANDFASLLDRVREGTEIVIEHNAQPMAVVRPAAENLRDDQRNLNDDEVSELVSPQTRLKNLQAIRFSSANQAERVQRSLQALDQPLGINLPAEQWTVVAGLSEDDED